MLHRLTKTEIKVLRLKAEGLSIPDIAKTLTEEKKSECSDLPDVCTCNTSKSTVSTHLMNVYGKLNLHHENDVTTKAIEIYNKDMGVVSQ